MDTKNEHTIAHQVARIAVYDDLLSAPRVIDIEPTTTAEYIEQIASRTYDLAQKQGGSIPYTVIREVSENFIHANFMEPVVSIMDKGNTIRFADQGPGITDKDRAQLPGFSSATSEMKEYIRGVGSGFPLVKEYLKFQNGRLVIEDNIKEGTVITITVGEGHVQTVPQTVVYQETVAPHSGQAKAQRRKGPEIELDGRSLDVISLAADLGQIGPTDLQNELGIPTGTGFRVLEKLEKAGIMKRRDRKRVLTDYGYEILDRQG